MTPDERYAEKLRARAEGRAPVIVTQPALPRGNTPAAIEARYKAKLARHGKPEPQPQPQPKGEGKGEPSGSAKPEVKPEAKGEQGQPAKPEPQPKGEGKGRRG